jgi:hypothetical protein
VYKDEKGIMRATKKETGTTKTFNCGDNYRLKKYL